MYGSWQVRIGATEELLEEPVVGSGDVEDGPSDECAARSEANDADGAARERDRLGVATRRHAASIDKYDLFFSSVALSSAMVPGGWTADGTGALRGSFLRLW